MQRRFGALNRTRNALWLAGPACGWWVGGQGERPPAIQLTRTSYLAMRLAPVSWTAISGPCTPYDSARRRSDRHGERRCHGKYAACSTRHSSGTLLVTETRRRCCPPGPITFSSVTKKSVSSLNLRSALEEAPCATSPRDAWDNVPVAAARWLVCNLQLCHLHGIMHLFMANTKTAPCYPALSLSPPRSGSFSWLASWLIG